MPPQDQGLCRLWLAGRWRVWELAASLSHLLLFLFQPLTQRASQAPCSGPHVALPLSGKQLRFARALTPPPHVQGRCQELGEAASGFQLLILSLHSPGPWLVGALCNREKSLGSPCLGPRLPTPKGKPSRGYEPLVSWVPRNHPVQRS